MKKFLAILLAMMMMMVSVAALAENPGDEPAQEETTATIPNLAGQLDDPKPTAAQTITINKVYTITLPDAVKNDSTLLTKYSLSKDSITFTVTGSVQAGSSTVTTAPTVSVSALSVNEVAIALTDVDDDGTVTKKFPLTITIPAYEEVGIYEYKITETKGSYQGIGYHTSPLYLRVTVVRINDTDDDGKITGSHLEIAGIALRDTSATDTETSSKIDSLENTYGAGRLSVTKEVSGNMGDQSQDFSITVTFTSANEVGATIKYSGADNTGSVSFTKAEGATSYTGSATLTIHHGEVVQFENIPAGVSYTVVEDTTSDTSAYKTQKYDNVSYQNNEATIAAADDIAATVTNTKNITPDTGITLETLPYVLMMALAMMGLVALKLRKREEY